MIGELFDEAIMTGRAVTVEYADGHRTPLPLHSWSGGLIDGDDSILRRCRGATLDVGCGPGRLAAAVAARGLPSLGIDVTPSAVRRAHERGAIALVRDVFDALPGQGRWRTVLLADGNIGIGGDPARLLRRVHELLAVSGRALVELTPAPHGRGQCAARLRTRDRSGEWFRWAEVGVDDVVAPASRAGLVVAARWTAGGRHFAELRPGAARAVA